VTDPDALLLAERKWYRLNEANIRRVPEAGGAYELGGRGSAVVYIGWAGSGELRTRLRSHVADPNNACIARSAFFFRFQLSDRPEASAAELLEVYRSRRYGSLPECMAEPSAGSPAGAPARRE
jgi:hypothetical protein